MGMSEINCGNGQHEYKLRAGKQKTQAGLWGRECDGSTERAGGCDGGGSQVEVVLAPAGPANDMSKSFQFNPGALAPITASLHSHTAQF